MTEHGKLEKRNAALQEKVTKLTRDKETLEERLKQTEFTLKDTENNRNAFAVERTRLQTSLEQLTNQVVQQDSHIAGIEAENKALHEENNEYRNNQVDLQDENNEYRNNQ